mmetsp:Transcript_10613/g.35259  ORF Transcript_10613/g.35259 Transcript_10613/m.35259 type:complete len:204 (+) Transcript_10613:1466-2077(+)
MISYSAPCSGSCAATWASPTPGRPGVRTPHRPPAVCAAATARLMACRVRMLCKARTMATAGLEAAALAEVAVGEECCRRRGGNSSRRSRQTRQLWRGDPAGVPSPFCCRERCPLSWWSSRALSTRFDVRSMRGGAWARREQGDVVAGGADEDECIHACRNARRPVANGQNVCMVHTRDARTRTHRTGTPHSSSSTHKIKIIHM